MVRDGASSHKMDYIDKFGKIQNLKRHRNCIIGCNLVEVVDLGYWWSCNGKGLRLQPVQQAYCRTAPATPGLIISEQEKEGH